MTNERTIEQLISTSERIGTIGSSSSTSELSLDILGTAVNKKLVGELALFRFSQDGKPHYALGQITEVQLKNIWLEDPTMRSLARQRGQVNPEEKARGQVFKYKKLTNQDLTPCFLLFSSHNNPSPKMP